jgi:hypothetical protein
MGKTRKVRNAPVDYRQHRAKKNEDGPFTFAAHAVDQLRARHMPSFTLARTYVEARILASTARRSDRRTPHGDEIWVAQDGYPIEFVVKPLPERTCVTVLPRKDRPEQEGVPVEFEEFAPVKGTPGA